MFDNYIVEKGSTQYIPYEKEVNINRAPTDESIKLYEEIKQKAYNSIIDTISVNDNSVNFVIQHCKNPLTQYDEWRYHLVINGKDFYGVIQMEEKLHFIHATNQKKVIEVMYKQVSKILAESFISCSLKSIIW